jgi:Tol biopolymer transport system component
MQRPFVLAILLTSLLNGPDRANSRNGFVAAEEKPNSSGQAGLAKEVRTKGWIVFSAQNAQGDWDLFLMRPDGSARRNITNTLDFHEAGARFSPDGQRILYYRIPKASKLDNNNYGSFELVLARADGSDPMIYGKEYSWASWGPRDDTISCLSKSGIQIVDLSTKKVVRALDRKGIFEQLFSSPDGKWLCGTANGLGQHWNIARMESTTGQLNPVSDGDCFNCTPDWFPDSTRIIFSKGIPCTLDYAQLWMANGDGTGRNLIYAETGRHIYGGMVSPDARYVLFTKSQTDLGKVDNSQTTMALMRLQDAPTIGGTSPELRKFHPEAKDGPVLDLSFGWEPHWTYAELSGKRTQHRQNKQGR